MAIDTEFNLKLAEYHVSSRIGADDRAECQGRDAKLAFFSRGRSNENFPKRTWKGEQAKSPRKKQQASLLACDSHHPKDFANTAVPFSCSITITSIAPLRVAGLMEL